jgi:phage baseplate assembly protein W
MQETITSGYWQMKLAEPGIVQGLSDIQQCIYIILVTKKGTDPTRPNFGCGIYDYIDKPINIALPNMKREIAEAIAVYEPRVKIIRILHAVDVEHLTFEIEWKFKDQTGTTKVSYGNS